MSAAITPKQTVAIVLKAIESKEKDSSIARKLGAFGVDPADASSIVSSIRLGFKAGVQSRVMGARAHPDGDPYYLSAFAAGRFAMRSTSPGRVLFRTIGPYAIGAGVTIYLVWHLFF